MPNWYTEFRDKLMKIILSDFPVLKENDRTYLLLLEGVINSTDELATLEIRKNPENYSFRISVSSSIYLSPLIKELNTLNNMCGIVVDFSKSIKSSCILFFKINLEDN